MAHTHTQINTIDGHYAIETELAPRVDSVKRNNTLLQKQYKFNKIEALLFNISQIIIQGQRQYF